MAAGTTERRLDNRVSQSAPPPIGHMKARAQTVLRISTPAIWSTRIASHSYMTIEMCPNMTRKLCSDAAG
jgi:hypothetical protein